MRIVWPHDLPAWAPLLSLVVHFACGIGLGVLYFRNLWWNARMISGGGRATAAIALAVGRFGLLGSLLTLTSLEGAPVLLATALGVLAGRSAVLRRVRKAAA